MKIVSHYFKLLKRYSYEFLFMIYLRDNPFKIFNLNLNVLNPKFVMYYFRVVIYGNLSDDVLSKFNPYVKKVIYSSKSCYEHYYVTNQTSIIPDKYINLVVSRLAGECATSGECLSDRIMWISNNLSIVTYNKVKNVTKELIKRSKRLYFCEGDSVTYSENDNLVKEIIDNE